MSTAYQSIAFGIKYPYDDSIPSDKYEIAAQGVLADLSDRGGIKRELEAVQDQGTRTEIVQALTDVIKEATKPQWHKFSDKKPGHGTQILWRGPDADAADPNAVGTGWFSVEDTDEWQGEWMAIADIL
jgi:hypothetical protein